MSSSLVRIDRIASSSSRASASGYQSRSRRLDPRNVGRLRAGWPFHGEGRQPSGAVDRHREMGVGEPVGLDDAIERRQRDALRAFRPVARRGEREGPLLHFGRELAGLGKMIDEPPLERFLAPHALARGAKDVGEVVADVALVGEAGDAAGARQHPEKRNFRQADRSAAVIDQQDLVAGERELVAAAGAGAVDRGQKLEPAVFRRILEAIAGFVGELAEVDLPGVARDAEHEDLGARAEHPIATAGDDRRPNFRMLEADPVDRVVEFDVDPEVIAVELELVARAQPGVLVEVGQERRHRSVEFELPVPVAGGLGLVVDRIGVAHRRLHDRHFSAIL